LQVGFLRYRQQDFEGTRRALSEAHRLAEPTAESLWLAVRAERKLGDRHAEASLTAQLRRNFPDSKEVRDMKRGAYE
jgi:type IV pilus assembly protein PilF